MSCNTGGPGGTAGGSSAASVLITASCTCLLALILASCGDAPVEPGPEVRARIAREAAFRARAEQAKDLLLESERHGRMDEPARAWELWREARDLVGETPATAKVAEIIRATERRLKEKSGFQAFLTLSNEGVGDLEGEARIEALGRVAAAGRAFLTDHPDSGHREEVEEGVAYADRELKLNRDYVVALEEAREQAAAGEWGKCLEACERVLAIRNDEAARDLVRRAHRALTPEGMICIPSGFFLSGPDREKVWLPAFYVDRTEVTNARYAEFVKATDHPAPAGFKEGRPPAGKEEHPVVQVTLEDALAFARWANRRLPTETEWERAARGVDGRAYPWGDEWDAEKGHFGKGGTLPVGSRPFDRSPDGVMDTGGNVMEMTLPADDPEGKSAGPVMKGGHWSSDFEPTYALTYARYPVDREYKDGGSGFRCVSSAAGSR